MVADNFEVTQPVKLYQVDVALFVSAADFDTRDGRLRLIGSPRVE